MNRRGFTLVEILVASALFVISIACFGSIIRHSSNYLKLAGGHSEELYAARTAMEKTRMIPFIKLLSINSNQLKVTPLSSDLYLIQAGKLITLRSAY